MGSNVKRIYGSSNVNQLSPGASNVSNNFSNDKRYSGNDVIWLWIGGSVLVVSETQVTDTKGSYVRFPGDG